MSLNPYITTVLQTTVSVDPHLLCCDVRDNIKDILITSLKHKCIAEGYIKDIYDINILSDGCIDMYSKKCNVTYLVEYECMLCKLSKNDIVVGRVDIITQTFIKLSNDAISIMVSADRINEINFYNQNNTIIYKHNNKPIEVGDYIIVNVETVYTVEQDTEIKVLGKLLNIAIDKDIDEYYTNFNK
jgi:DNA-directed RNA polymerase subunit E'/Rpb7